VSFTDYTWVNDEVPTFAQLNVRIRDNLRELWRELLYVEWTGTFTPASVRPTVADSGTITYTAFPIMVEFFAPAANSGSSDFIKLALWDGATDLGHIARVGGGGNMPVRVGRRLTPTAASHNYLVKLEGGSAGSGIGQVMASTGGAGNLLPGYIRVMQKASA
jgi:hypothetical protein